MNRIRIVVAGTVMLWMSTTFAHSPPDSARVFFVNLQDGATVTSPFSVIFGITGFGVTTAGDKAKNKHTAGHHHLLIDLERPLDMEQPLPYTKDIMHFDQGETETILELPAGQHTLQLLLADEDHESYDPPLMSKKITITVK